MSAPAVATTAGKVRGVEIDDGILTWRGIPYAAAPVGDLRLRPPRPAQPWSGTRDGTQFGPPAVQAPLGFTGDGLNVLGEGLGGQPHDPLPEPSEDCLFVNVTAPAGASDRPVLVWIHGGGYQIGHGSDMAGDGATFARTHGIVVVTFNYRLGAFGFLSVEGEEPTGALGLHDQIAALRWVRDNIAAFGGDPAQVTVYGLSAGAKSVANLLASPLTRGLIRRAASSSGGGDHVATPAQSAALSVRFFRELGTSPRRVRQVSAEDLLGAQNAIGTGSRATWLWRPAIDGTALTARPVDAIAAGAAPGIPLLAQTCVDECFIFQLASPDATQQTDRVLEEYFGVVGRDAVLSAYVADPELAGDPVRTRLQVMTDERYTVPTRRLAGAQAAHAPVWLSRYDGPLTGLIPGISPSARPGAFHGTDGGAIWNTGHVLHDVWGSFVRDGRPAAAGLPDWPGCSAADRPTLVFDDASGPHLAHAPYPDRYAAWDGLDWTSGTWWDFDGVR
ncbi:carboxylesterase family protein [Streptomyces sp. SID13726]|uniref:carboxylesterase/lipase family protein n=1 Tax=Streptomyces sp. SID13726 TaxID=2706058 RepID=UPI0013B71AFF|nr:carboxylesterase family protein [Streptomyces sp. SID13726]NEB03494.1 carboxylesterase/lipase family protein [Streptomyces sp. SID13726]